MTESQVIACAGLENLIIIQSGDQILIADRTKPQSLQHLMTTLKQEPFSQPMQIFQRRQKAI
jgi:hypothetical protein